MDSDSRTFCHTKGAITSLFCNFTIWKTKRWSSVSSESPRVASCPSIAVRLRTWLSSELNSCTAPACDFSLSTGLFSVAFFSAINQEEIMSDSEGSVNNNWTICSQQCPTHTLKHEMTLSRHYTSLIFMYFVSLRQRMTENLSQEQLNAVPVRQILFKGSISTWKKKTN